MLPMVQMDDSLPTPSGAVDFQTPYDPWQHMYPVHQMDGSLFVPLGQMDSQSPYDPWQHMYPVPRVDGPCLVESQGLALCESPRQTRPLPGPVYNRFRTGSLTLENSRQTEPPEDSIHSAGSISRVSPPFRPFDSMTFSDGLAKLEERINFRYSPRCLLGPWRQSSPNQTPLQAS